MAKNQQQTTRRSHAGRAVALTTLAAAAALVGAAYVYLRRRGIDPKQAAKRVGARAKSVSALLSGEAKAAYQDVRQAIVDELALRSERPTQRTVLAATNRVLAALRKHGTLTKTELAAVAEQLRADLASIQQAAQTKKKT